MTADLWMWADRQYYLDDVCLSPDEPVWDTTLQSFAAYREFNACQGSFFETFHLPQSFMKLIDDTPRPCQVTITVSLEPSEALRPPDSEGEDDDET